MKNIIALVFLFIFIVSCTNSVPLEKSCSVDDDCVPKECCHSREAVNKAYAAGCSGIVCTMNCEPGTLDCGQGEVKCISGECRAVIVEGNVISE